MIKSILTILIHHAVLFGCAAQSVNTLMGARAAGAGYASSTITDEWTMSNNIGGLGRATSSSAGFAYEIHPSLIGANRMSANINIPSTIGVVGIGVFKFGDDVYSEHILSTGFGNTIGNTSIGAKANYIQYRAESLETSLSFSFDFGGITQISKLISVGAYVTNLTQSKLIGINGSRLPTRLVIGAGFKPNEKIFITSEIEKDLEFSSTWRSGIEYAIYRKVFFRTGFSANPNSAHFGLGIVKSKIKFDYAVIFNRLVGAVHQGSAVYIIPSKQKK
ncbi:MAG: hypothetical protein QM734_10815 [Cyclobacteriaceae bacterium]